MKIWKIVIKPTQFIQHCFNNSKLNGEKIEREYKHELHF